MNFFNKFYKAKKNRISRLNKKLSKSVNVFEKMLLSLSRLNDELTGEIEEVNVEISEKEEEIKNKKKELESIKLLKGQNDKFKNNIEKLMN